MARVLQALVNGAGLSGGRMEPLISPALTGVRRHCLAQHEVGSGNLGGERGMPTRCLVFGELPCVGCLLISHSSPSLKSPPLLKKTPWAAQKGGEGFL